MVICAAYGCSNRTDRKQRKPGVSFHKFPKDKSLREQWVKAVHRLNWEPGVNSYLCSEHFSAEFLNRTFASGRTELRENAVPTIFSNYPSHLQPPIKKICKPPRSRADEPKPTSVESMPPCILEHIECSSQELMEISEPPSKEVAVQVSGDSIIKELVNHNKHLEWKINALQSRLDQKSIAIKKLKKQNVRLNVRISSLKSLIKQLKSKNLTDDECVLTLENMAGLQRELFLMNTKKNRTLSPVIRAFAMTMDFYSPKAYRYLRQSFNSALPHPRTLARWYSTVDASPGFCAEA